MYQVHASGTLLFTSNDLELVKSVARVYRQLYAWSVVQVKRKKVSW